jgi:hypothetical protein
VRASEKKKAEGFSLLSTMKSHKKENYMAEEEEKN